MDPKDDDGAQLTMPEVVIVDDDPPPTEPSPSQAPTKPETPNAKRVLRGFAAMKAKGQNIAAIASKGGRAAHAAGTAHRWTSETASAAGKKGGVAPHRSRGKAAT